MGAFNRFETIKPTEFQLPQIDLNVLSQVLETRQKRFDLGADQYDDIENQYVDAYKTDRAEANAIQEGWRQAADKIVENYQGDYSEAYRELRKLRSNIKRDLSPGGKAAAIVNNKTAITEALADAQKRFSEGKISAEDLKLQQEYIDKTYSGVGEKDPITGNYNIAQPERIQDAVDAYKLGLEAVGKLAPQGSTITRDRISGNWIITDTQGVKEVAPDIIYDAVTQRLLNDDNYISATRQRGKMLGLEGQDLDYYLLNNIDSQGKALQPYAYKQTVDDVQRKPNAVALHEDSERRKDIRAGKLLNAIDTKINYQKVNLDYTGNQHRKVEIGDISRIVGGGEISPTSSLTAWRGEFLMKNLFPGILGRYKLLSDKDAGVESIEKVVESGAFQEVGGNPQLMSRIIGLKKAKGEKATGEQLLKEYNEIITRAGSADKPAAIVIAGDTGKKVASELLAGQMLEHATIRVDGEPMLAKEFRSKFSDIYDKQGNVKPKFENTIITDATIGSDPVFVYKMGDKTITISAPPAYVAALKPITTLAEGRYNADGYSNPIQGLNYAYTDYDDNGNPRRAALDQSVIRLNSDWAGETAQQLKEVERLEELNPETGEWEPITIKPSKDSQRRYLKLDEINRAITDQALKINFGVQDMTATGKNTLKLLGQEYLGGFNNNN